MSNHPESTQPLISLRDVSVHYSLGSSALARLTGRGVGTVKALDGITLDIAPGEVVGLVGESGSGKSTTGRALLGMAPVKSGSIRYRGDNIVGLSESKMRPLRKKLQMIFQDPAAALNPTMTIFDGIADGLRIHGVPESERTAGVHEAMERVGLAPVDRFEAKYPSELSGGQKQRAVIARALALKPELLVADEPISMLDMSVRAKVLELMASLRDELGISFLYITHDLASARFFCDRIAIMYLGRIVETGPTEEIFANPQHPYTMALLAAVPDITQLGLPENALPRGEVPDAANPPQGCSFHPRCPVALPSCGFEGRDLTIVLEQRWMRVDPAVFAEESELFGNSIQHIKILGGVWTIPTKDPARVLLLLKKIREENPEEPFFGALNSMQAGSSGVELHFATPSEPQLLPLATTAAHHVSCLAADTIAGST